MSLQIPITGIGADWRVPGGYAEILFAQGPASASAGVRAVVFVMPKLSTGTWTAATLYSIGSEKDAEDGFGAGSPGHRAVRKFFQINKDAPCFGVPVAETTGGSPIAATSTVTFTTTPTARGVATVTVCGEECSYGYTTTDTVSSVAAGIKAAINAKSWLPVTADNSSGILTITAKLKGISQGTASVPVISVRAVVTTGTGITVACTGAVGTGVIGVEGSTTEAASTATALAAIDNVRKYYVVSSANDATTLGHFKTHITNKSEPRRGLRSVAIAAYPGTAAACTTIATGLNYERIQLNWLENPDNDCAEIAGAIAAIRQKEEAVDATKNLSMWSLSGILSNAYATSDWPSDTELNDAINDGISPIKSSDSGPVWVMNLNTRSKNAAGTQDDFRATEAHRVSGADLYTDEVLADWALNMSGKKLEDDNVLADGKPDPNQRLRAGVIRPSTYKPRLLRFIDDFYNRNHLQNLQATKDSVRVVKSGSRLECGQNLHIIDHALQATFRVAEVSTG
jgi:phage tail sheath gpL-like